VDHFSGAARFWRFRSDREGNVVVETAIVTPFVLLAAFGAVDIVRYLNIQVSVIR
jgi:Flp pilus assembly protein TadG